MKISGILAFATITWLIVSCTETPVFDDTYTFEDRKWDQLDKPKFEVVITDTTKEYNFTLTLRTTTDYKYRNLWIFMKTLTPDGATAREPFQIPITDDKGNWLGTKTGSVVESPLSFMGRRMPEKGTYRFTVEQGITLSEIDEVLDIGLRVIENKEK